MGTVGGDVIPGTVPPPSGTVPYQGHASWKVTCRNGQREWQHSLQQPDANGINRGPAAISGQNGVRLCLAASVNVRANRHFPTAFGQIFAKTHCKDNLQHTDRNQSLNRSAEKPTKPSTCLLARPFPARTTMRSRRPVSTGRSTSSSMPAIPTSPW